MAEASCSGGQEFLRPAVQEARSFRGQLFRRPGVPEVGCSGGQEFLRPAVQEVAARSLSRAHGVAWS